MFVFESFSTYSSKCENICSVQINWMRVCVCVKCACARKCVWNRCVCVCVCLLCVCLCTGESASSSKCCCYSKQSARFYSIIHVARAACISREVTSNHFCCVLSLSLSGRSSAHETLCNCKRTRYENFSTSKMSFSFLLRYVHRWYTFLPLRLLCHRFRRLCRLRLLLRSLRLFLSVLSVG